MPRDDKQYITNTNDRHRLILYHYISNYRTLSFLERFEFKRLERIYVDNYRYKEDLTFTLIARGFLAVTNDEITQDKYGNLVYANDLPKETVITELGEKALKSGLLPSETRKAFINFLKDWAPIIVSIIAVIITLMDN